MPKYSLDSVTIDGFRGLRNLRLDGLGLINILVGKNDSGKTSVLEALSILCNPLDPLEWAWMVYRRDFGGIDETRLQSLRWCFPQSGQLADRDFPFEGACSMSCDGTFPLRKLEVSCRDIVSGPGLQRDEGKPLESTNEGRLRGLLDAVNDEPDRGIEIEHILEWADGESETVRDRLWERLPSYPVRHVREKRVMVQSLTPYSYQINQVQVRSLSRLRFDPDSWSSILDLIREFDPDIQEIDIVSFRGIRPAIYLKHRRLGPAPLSIFGDGLRRAVLLAGALLDLKDGGLLLIDEMEAGIHVRALQRVFAWLTKAARELRVQIVATTHSLEAVDGIVVSNKNRIDDVVAFHLDRTEHETRAKRIYGDLLLRLRYESGLDVR
jgi:AAA domain, putative AbiEii toxin, Type IV TA system/AAA ATPase domain